MRRVVVLLLVLSGSVWAQKKTAPPTSPAPSLTATRTAIQAVLTERDRAFGARDATAYFAPCTAEFVQTDPQQDMFPREKLQTQLQKTLSSAKTAEQKTQIDSVKLDGDAAQVETYESLKLFSLSHEWLEITTTGYRRCRYRFVQEGNKWRIARARVLEDPLTEIPRLREAPGLKELEQRVKNADAQAATREIFPHLEALGTAQEQKDFRPFFSRLAPDFLFIRLGKDPENRETFTKNLELGHQFIENERIRYYLMGAELLENGELLLEVEEATRYTLQLPETKKEDSLVIVNLNLTWTRVSGAWYLKRYEYFTADGFTNGQRDDFIQKEKNKKKRTTSR